MRLFDSSLDHDVFGNPMPSRGCPATDFAVDPPPLDSECVTSISYDEYGSPRLAASADSEFVGRYTYDQYDYDVNAEFYDCNARCYDPTPGRWLNQDPLGFDAGDTNLYRYHVPAQGQLLSEE